MMGRETEQKGCQAAFKLAGEGAWEHSALLGQPRCPREGLPPYPVCRVSGWGGGSASRRAAAQKLNPRHLLTHLCSWGSFPPAKTLLLLPVLSLFLESVLLLSPITGWTLLFVGGSSSGQVRASKTGSRRQGTRGCVCSGGRRVGIVTQPSHSAMLRTGLTQDPGSPAHFKLIAP